MVSRDEAPIVGSRLLSIWRRDRCGTEARTFPSRWRRRHDGATNPANAVEDRRRIGLYVIVTCQVERLAHPHNIPLRKSGRMSAWKLVSLLIVPPCTRQSTSQIRLERTVGQTVSDAYGYKCGKSSIGHRRKLMCRSRRIGPNFLSPHREVTTDLCHHSARSRLALPPVIAAIVAASNVSTEATWPTGSDSAIS
jgi:hypothetical protein